MSSEMVWNLVNRTQLTYILREVSEPRSADIGESPWLVSGIQGYQIGR